MKSVDFLSLDCLNLKNRIAAILDDDDFYLHLSFYTRDALQVLYFHLETLFDCMNLDKENIKILDEYCTVDSKKIQETIAELKKM